MGLVRIEARTDHEVRAANSERSARFRGAVPPPRREQPHIGGIVRHRARAKDQTAIGGQGRIEILIRSVDRAAEIGRLMELFDQQGIGMVLRVIPDPAKDFGFNILSAFHYHRLHKTITCEKLLEAAEILDLEAT